ncbi:thioredoxin family protein [Xylocopilactobacillus apis]|uniref:Thiol reductase thioredoxin n=1 Tax=Xylocopilactobacillus apis TaxID=2932183 RepID=A0AAU9CR53_9LACO|nr:thioredoxin family protein [Xylocopilactobacillus apis]BDR56399.1 thiol reductase thioredoxin [Xylocopilactobacillus apis]
MNKFSGNEGDLNQGLNILVFTADWCGDCKFIKPFMPLVEKEYSQFNFIEIDIDQHKELAEKMSVKGIPSFIALNNGEEIGRFVNGDRKTKEEIDQFISGLKYK